MQLAGLFLSACHSEDNMGANALCRSLHLESCSMKVGSDAFRSVTGQRAVVSRTLLPMQLAWRLLQVHSEGMCWCLVIAVRQMRPLADRLCGRRSVTGDAPCPLARCTSNTCLEAVTGASEGGHGPARVFGCHCLLQFAIASCIGHFWRCVTDLQAFLTAAASSASLMPCIFSVVKVSARHSRHTLPLHIAGFTGGVRGGPASGHGP